MEPHARWTLPAAVGSATRRSLYFFKGASLSIGGQRVDAHAGMELRCSEDLELVNGPEASELLVLQGRPIAETVAQYGPFVMNTQAEIQQAFADYQRTGFGGWPWSDDAPVHDRQAGRFARHADGSIEEPEPGAASLQDAAA
jgi:redox-sensitive bicupin YhaK (pirin superfamily)